jgi:hypothetical protein
VFAALVGLLVSALAWLFLEAVHALQVEVYTKLPGHLGFDTVPAWWPLPWLAPSPGPPGSRQTRCSSPARTRSARAGLAVAPLVIVAAVVAYLRARR